MNKTTSLKCDDRSEPCILIEGPKWADAEFYGRWLVAAARANRFWLKALKNPIFEKRIERLTVVYILDFTIGATVMLSQLKRSHLLHDPPRRRGSGIGG